MVSPSYENKICAMFDSFSKTVSRNYYRDLLRAEKRRNRNCQEEPVDYLLELLGQYLCSACLIKSHKHNLDKEI